MSKSFLLGLLWLIFPATTLAQGEIHQRSTIYEAPKDEQVIKKLKHWQDLKFGVLMHWGLYSVPGIVVYLRRRLGDARHHLHLSTVQRLVLGAMQRVQSHEV